MPTAPIAIHSPIDIASFHLLFLSEGFLAGDQNQFLDHCRAITAELLAVDPFRLAQRQISVVAAFTASQQQGVANAAGNTAFRFFLNPAGELRTRRPGTIVAQIADITPVPLGGNPPFNPPLPATGTEVWMRESTRGNRAVCVIVRHAARAVTLTNDYEAGDLDDPADDTPELAALVPFVAVTMWPALAGAPQQYTNAPTAAAAALVRQLGAIFGLGYESELTDAAHERYNLPLPEPDAPNLVTDRALRSANVASVERIPWRGLVSATRRASPVVERDHPALVVAGETPVQETARYAPIGELMNTNVVLLRHPVNPANPNDTSGLTGTPYRTLGRLRLVRRDPHLIEGGGGFRRGIYRPSVDCLMRSEGHDIPQQGGAVTRQVEPFCAVCEQHLATRLQTGSRSFRFGSIRLRHGPADCVGALLPSRLAARFLEWIRATAIPNGMICVEATVNRYERFFREILNWPDLQNVRVDGWYNADDPIEFPVGAGVPLFMWAIWMTNQTQLSAVRGLRQFAGLGAPGAIWYAGLGCITNTFRRVYENDPAGNRVRLRFANSLVAADLARLTPGSVLQIWTNQQTYENVVRFAHGVLAAEPVAGGHSLYYMGTDANGNHIVADQNGVAGSFAGWHANYTFVIAAQWFDAENVPPAPAP
ncbi:MAG TPA: hypothetical protein VJ802_18070 [Gemmatimonadaceae bacterium]|nr:hypothetical protein [Gemmatimonadaceae bacterium]